MTQTDGVGGEEPSEQKKKRDPGHGRLKQRVVKKFNMPRGVSGAYLEPGRKKGGHPRQCEWRGGGKCTNSTYLCSILEFF